MARKVNRLSARAVAAATKPGLHPDGAGLYLRVTEGGTKSWMFRFMLHGRSRDMGLGPIRVVSLADARAEAEGCRKLLRQGIDPVDARNSDRSRLRLEAAKAMSFRECAEAYIAAHQAGWKSAKHAAQWPSTLQMYVYPKIGDLPVQSIDTALVMRVLEPIWREKTETATRVRGRIESVLDWASARHYRQGENPARWKGHLENLLPARAKIQKVKHHVALPYTRVGAFMDDLRKIEGVSARGLEFTLLTAARTGEVMGATWSEIDFDGHVWTVPAERMKSGKVHRVPLSEAAMAVLKKMQDVQQSDFVFPGTRPKKPLSKMTFLHLLERMERPELTAHGLRSTFRDWAAERTAYPNELVEMALAHAITSKVEAAYRRGDLFEKRRRLMEDWGVYCATTESQSGNVVSLKLA